MTRNSPRYDQQRYKERMAKRVMRDGHWFAPDREGKHGLLSTSVTYGCSCEPCRGARAKSQRERAARKKAKKQREKESMNNQNSKQYTRDVLLRVMQEVTRHSQPKIIYIDDLLDAVQGLSRKQIQQAMYRMMDKISGLRTLIVGTAWEYVPKSHQDVQEPPANSDPEEEEDEPDELELDRRYQEHERSLEELDTPFRVGQLIKARDGDAWNYGRVAGMREDSVQVWLEGGATRWFPIERVASTDIQGPGPQPVRRQPKAVPTTSAPSITSRPLLAGTPKVLKDHTPSGKMAAVKRELENKSKPPGQPLYETVTVIDEAKSVLRDDQGVLWLARFTKID